MKISEHWLREWVSSDLDVKTLAQRLTLGGLEVSALEPAGPQLSGVVVGQIRSVRPHPGAERLKLCSVSIGHKKTLEIVSGAANATSGAKVPVALPGTELPAGVKVDNTQIREAQSEGMLCSAADLGLAESSVALLELGPDARPGASVARYLGLDDIVLELELTPNRGDCLSVVGIAREVAALTDSRLHPVKIRHITPHTRQRLEVRLLAGHDCARYVGRAIEGLNTVATTPVWMVERLRRSGVRSIGPVVDVTNYVMLELGQPMHAFDLEQLGARIEVRHAREGESLTLLDGTKMTLPRGALVIADAKTPVALAGIMGGSNSGVSERTKSVFLESAYFRPETIAKYARSLAVQTESSYRFERGVDPQLQRSAIERATMLLQEIAGGRPGPVVEAALTRYLPKQRRIVLRRKRIEQLLDVSLPTPATERLLRRLGMRTSKSTGGWRVVPPSYRFDIQREIDLVEEIARAHGYEKLPSRLPRVPMSARVEREDVVSPAQLKALLVGRDYQEIITYSFVDPELQALVVPGVEGIRLANPISADMSVMRASLWPGLLGALIYNRNRQQQRLRMFEVGRCFQVDRGITLQEPMLGAMVSGPIVNPQWAAPARAADFYDLKGDMEALLQTTGRRDDFLFMPARDPTLHPGQQALVTRAGVTVGRIGALHPYLTAKLDVGGTVYLFEISISALQHGRLPILTEISRYPGIQRDLSLIVDNTMPAQAVLDCVSETVGGLLVDLQLFDQYRGEGIDSGRKSLALSLTLQDSSRTLREEVIEAVMGRVIGALQSRLGAELRRK